MIIFWKRERKSILISLFMVSGIAFLFFDSIYAMLAFPGIYFLVRNVIKKEEAKKTKLILKDEFRDMILSMAAALEGGNSVERTMLAVEGELRMLYGEKSVILQAVHQLIIKVEANHSIEKAFEEMALEIDLREAVIFAETFKIGKRIGGDMNQIIMDTVEIISRKIQTEKEIENHLAGKKFEFRIMCATPFAIIAYVRLSSPGYFNPLYHNLTGILIMVIVLFCIFGAYEIGKKVISIDV